MQGRSHILMSALGYVVVTTWIPQATTLPPLLTRFLPPLVPGELAQWGGVLMAVGLAGISGLVPDIDHPQASLAQWTVARLGPVRIRPLYPVALLASQFGHRKATHSLYAALAICVLAALLYPLLGGGSVALAWGYATHILCDMMTRSGVELFWPHSAHNHHLLPRAVRFATGTWPEAVVVGATSLLVAGWVLFVAYLTYGGSA